MPGYSERLHVATYGAILDVPRDAVHFLFRLLATERGLRGTRKGARALTCFHQAVVALRYFRDGTGPATLARDPGTGRSTAYRCIDEATEVPADQAPDLHRTLNKAHHHGVPHLIPDGIVIPTGRCSQKTTSVKGKMIDPWYSGKSHHHGGNVQGVMEPDGFPVSISDVEPGSVNDLLAARTRVLGALYAAAAQGLPTLADLGHQGAGIGVITPIEQLGEGPPLAPESVPSTNSSGACAIWASAGSRYSLSGGGAYSTSPPAPARSGALPETPPLPHMSSTGTWNETRWDHLSGPGRHGGPGSRRPGRPRPRTPPP